MADPILVERSGAIAVVTFNRPEKRNALDVAARAMLASVFAELEAAAEVRCVVLTGAGTAFCAGTDLSGGAPPATLVSAPLVAPVADFTRPVIAAVNGPAVGGGFEFALASDLRIASDSATFALPELRIGSLPGSGGTQRIFRALPAAVAATVLYAGRALSAADAERYGLVSEVHPVDRLLDAAVALAEQIATAAPLSLVAAKRAARVALESTGGLELERTLWAELAATEDRQEGRAAFREKRPPNFTGR